MSDNQKNNNNNNHKKGENHRRNHETNSKPQSKQKPVKEPEATTGKKSSIEINQQKGNQKSHRDVPNVGQDSVPRKQQSSHADNEASNTERKPKDQYGKAHKRSESESKNCNETKQICTFFLRNGRCDYGDKCRFEHTESNKHKKDLSSKNSSNRNYQDSTVDIPPEVLNLLEKIKTKHYNEGLVINEHNRSTWLTAFSIVLLPNSKNLAKYLPSLLRTYGSLPENDHTVVPASQILIAMTKSIESKSIPTIEIFTLIQEIMTKRLSHERSLQTIQNKEEISNLLLPELRKAARNATDDAIDSKLDNAFEELKKSISLYKQLVDNFELVLEMEQVHQNFWEKWSNKPSISWLLELPFQEARDFEDNYQSLDDYIRSMKETWLMMTFYWGAAACSPRCCFKSQDNKACGEPLIHGASKGKDRKPQLCSQRIRVNNESGSCNASAEWGCFRKGHDLFCKDCLREKQFKICRSTQGKDSSTDIYDCNITTSTIVGESLLLHCNELLSRHPPSAEFPINWRTTYRLQQAQLVAVIPKVVRCMALDSTDKIYWGEIICPQSKSGNSDDESTRRKKGQISIRLLGKQDCDLLEDFGLIAGDSQFRSKATIAIIDLRVFVPEVISVLATMSSNEFVKGLQHANFKPLLLNSVSAPMENIPTGVPLRNMIFYGLQHSTIATVRLLSNELINNLTDELWKINQIRSLDDTQGKSFAMALMHSLHTCQGPPGSGKSFVGVCLVLALSKIRQFVKHKLGSSLGPIIVLAYKNHALDEFLVDVLRADVMLMKEKGRLIRLGKPDEEMLLEFTETRNRMEFEAQKELENRLEIIKRVKTEIKNIAGAMMSEYVEAEKYFRCLSLYSLIDSTREPTPTEAFDNLVDFCRNDLLWTETIDAFGSELLLSTEHIQIDKLRKVAAVDCTEKESLHKFKVMWGKWLRGESIPPRCILNVPVKKGKRNKQQEDTMIQCFNCASESSQFCAEIHRCLFKNRINDTEVCCGKSRIDLDKMLYCEIHVCDDEDCLNSKSLQGSYCNSHSCSICFEFKQSSKHSCTEHKCSHCDKVVLSKSNGDCFKFCSDHSCSVCISESILDGKCNIAPNAGIACKLHACSLYPTCENIKHPGLEFCFNHLCKHCLEPVTDESHYCLEHKCTEENCHDAKAIVRTAEDEVFLCGYCANHSCLVCATLFAQGQIESIFLATSSRQTCDHHFLCPGMLPSGEDCCAIVDGGNEYCATHSFDLVNTCRGITSKNVNCRSIAISGTGYCKDHQQQKPPASANSFMCEEKSKLFLNLPPAANTIIASVNTEKKPPFKKCNERHCDAQCLLLHPMDSWLCNLHATAQENTASLESLAVETIAAEPVMPILPSNQEFTANSKIPPKERCVKRILLDSDDEDVPAPANDMKYFNGSANPDEMDYNEESEQFEDDMEAGAVEHNREIYQEEVDELEGMGIEEEDDGDHLENDNRTTDYEFNVHRFDDVDSAADYIDTLNNLSNFDWDLSSQDRLNLVNRYFSMSIQYLRLILRYADKHVDEARRMRAEASGAALKKAAIIGGTIVGAAKRLSALRAAEPFAVIVEEACEVLEPTLISVLSVSSLQKLELIGDHRQLPAFVNQYWYNIEMIRPKIKKSLFERIVLGVGEYANHPVCTILNMQRRMRTSISALTKTEYADIVQLIDHKCTAIQKIGDRYSGEDNIEGIQKLWATSGRSVPGIQSNIFFWDLQDNKESKASVGLSACNENEADAVTKLVKYLHQSCLVPLECITIITPYQGQKRQLVKSLRLEKLLPGAMHNNKPPTETKNNKSSGDYAKAKLTVSTVDRYQGDENDIVILSTVRVKPGNRFVSLLNRFIVAASRARLGFYIVGSKSAVSEVNPTTGALKGPPHWLTFLNHLSNKSIDHNDLDGFDRKRIDQTIPICCPQHRQKSHRDVPSLLKDRKFPCASNWNTFCSELCDFHLRCGHNCNQPCHMFDPWNHQKRCQKPIKNPCELHSNALLSCVEIVELQTNDMSCVEDVFLVPDLWKCNRRVVVKLAHCGHAMYLFCHQYKKCKAKEQKWPQCQEVVDNFTLPCGHIIEGPKCWEYDQYLSGKLPQCSQPVMIQKRGCSHEHEVACHQVEEETRKPCTKKINHPRPRCKHDMSFLCCDAQELDKMWRSKYRVCHLNEQGQSELLESEPYGPPESILMPSKNITKCHKKITIKRTCGHECKLICDEGFDLVNQKKLPKCKQKVTISCPLCKHETFQVDCCFKDLYQVVALESFNMLQDSEGNLNEFVNILKLDVLAYEGADVIFNKLLSSNCPQHLSFYKPSCDHMMTFACHDLLRLIMNNMQLPLCEESIDRILPCGHSVEIMCYQRHDHPPVCKEQSPPFQFPTCEHSLQVKTCTEFMKTKQRFDEGKLFCKALSEVQLPRCGHNVDIVCGKRQQGVQLQRKGAKLIDNTVIESIVYCIPCEEAPRCEERVTFERQCGHFDNSIFCQDAFSWTQEAVPKKIPPLCRQYIQSVLHPLCGHATDVPCWMKNAFATWNPWGEGQAGDWLNSADLPLQIESTPTVASSALVKHFIHPAKGSATSNSLVKYSFTDASSDVLSCSEVIQVVFADCGHSTACKCGMFFMANFGSQLGAATPSLQCGESVSRLCSEGHARSMPCHESKALSDISNIDKVCTAKMDKCCLYCGVNMVVSKCCDRDVFCNQEVTTTLSCGHVVSWKCSDNIDSNHDPRESFDPKHQLYLKCKGCMVELWEKEKTLTISLEDLRQHCLRQAKSVIGEDISDPVEIEIASIFESTYERARLDIICNFQRFIYKNSVEAVEKFEFPKDWDLDEVHRPDRYVANNYELVFLNCDLDKQPDVKLIHQRRFETKDTIFGTSLKVQRLTKDALFALAREGEVKIAVALAFRLHEKTMKEGFVTPNQVDTEMKKHANKLMIKTLQEGFDYATEDKEDQNSYLYFWKAKAVVPLYILHLTLHTTCNICLENHPNHRKYGAICSSNHFVCWDCLGDYIEAAEAADAIGGYVDATGGLVCPEPNCKKHQQIYDQNLLRSSAPQAIFERLWNLKIKIEANKAEQKVAAAAEEKLKIELDRIKSMGDTQRQVHFLRQKIIDDILTSRCPRCKQAYYYSDFDNCFALSCVNKSCKAEFCAWCEEDCGEDAHRHVANCQYNTNRGHVHGSKQDLKKVKIKIQTAKIEQLLNQEKPQITKEVLNSSKMELEDFKEYLAACGIK